MNKQKENRGITLISLIITIIVMLILVAVTVTTVINSGLIGKTQDAAEDLKTEYEKESKINNITIKGQEYGSITDYINRKENKPTITAGQRADKNSEYSDGTDTAVIPAGFTVSGVKTKEVDETTIESGLVIYLIPEGVTVDWTDGDAVATAQQTYDQFVWIPVNDINDMYMCQSEGTDTNGNGTIDDDEYNSCRITVKNVEGEEVAYCTTHNSTAMAGRLYGTYEDSFDASMSTQKYTEGHGLREPDTVSTYDGKDENLGYLSDILESNTTTNEYTSIENFKVKLQAEYNEVVKCVCKNKGFYVGRYETSNITTTSGEAVKTVKGTASGINNIDWYHIYAQQVKYAENNHLNVGSTMIQGAAYDQVMKFVDTEDYKVTAAENVEHNFDNVYNTGSHIADQSKNIYDLEGNVLAWTTEVQYNVSRDYRGGNYREVDSACERKGSSPESCSRRLGSLIQIYIK